MEQLALALKDYQERNELSLRALARELGVAHGTAESWLKGWRKPDYKHLPIIIEKIEADELTVYRWLTADENTNLKLRVLGLAAHLPLLQAA